MARHVAALSQRCALGLVHLFDPANNLGHPRQAILQDAIHAGLQRLGRDRTAAARTLELYLDHSGFDVRRYQGQIAAILLDDRTHEINDREQRLQALDRKSVV